MRARIPTSCARSSPAGRAGVDAIYAHPDAAAAIVARDFHLTPAIATKAVDNMLAPHMWSEGNFDQAELDRVVAALRLIDEVHGPVDWSKLIDASFLPADLQDALRAVTAWRIAMRCGCWW